MKTATTSTPPVLVLGGQENALSVVRSLSRRGLRVNLSAREDSWALRSRYLAAGYVVPTGTSASSYWSDLLLGPDRTHDGAVLFACSDEAIQFMASRRSQLASRYQLDDHVAEQQIALLDKRRTLELARQAGVPAPKQWAVEKVTDVDRFSGELDFPVLVRPVHSHLFQQVYNKKLLMVKTIDELRARLSDAIDHNLQVTVCELIPGPDSLLSSYYTYITTEEEHLFHFTKRVIRRSPPNFGAGVYHITEWLPETAELGRRFFHGMGFRGLGNIEFKRDPRDGLLKIIEVNARFTAAQELLVRSGMDIAWIIYCHVAGMPRPHVSDFEEELRLWYLVGDVDAYRDLRARGEISFTQWIKSISHRQVLPFFDIRDPAPALALGRDTFQRRVLNHLRAAG